MQGASGSSSPVADHSPGAPAASSAAADRLAERYGRTRDPRRSRRAMWLLAGVLAVLGSAFLVWVIVHHLLGPTVQAQEVSFVVAPDETSVEVVFDISMPPGHQADCTLEALDRNFGQAGLVDVRVGPFEATTVRLSETIATSAAPVTAQIRSCELVP